MDIQDVFTFWANQKILEIPVGSEKTIAPVVWISEAKPDIVTVDLRIVRIVWTGKVEAIQKVDPETWFYDVINDIAVFNIDRISEAKEEGKEEVPV